MPTPTALAHPPSGLASVLDALTARWPQQVSTAQSVRDHHANTLTWIAPQPPDAVFFATSTAEVQELVRLCAAHCVPVIPFGIGTSLEGHVNAPRGAFRSTCRA